MGGCSRTSDKASLLEAGFGEPVGVTMNASKGAPSFEIALAVSKGVDPTALVAPVSGLLHHAVEGCPDAPASVQPGEVVSMSLRVDAKRIHVTDAGRAGDDCLSRALEGAALDAQDKLQMLVQIRFAKP